MLRVAYILYTSDRKFPHRLALLPFAPSADPHTPSLPPPLLTDGFQLGQHRLPGDKRHLYEHNVRIPMVMRGPGIAAGSTIDGIVLNIDVAPTIVDLVTGGDGSGVPDDMDGRSFLPLLAATRPVSTVSSPAPPNSIVPWRSEFMVDYHGQGKMPCGLQTCPPPQNPHNWHENDAYNNTYSCVRSFGEGPKNAMCACLCACSCARVAALRHRPRPPAHVSLHCLPPFACTIRMPADCEFVDTENFVEYFEHDTDPWQMANAWRRTDAATLAAYHTRLEQFKACKGKACRAL